MEHSFIIGVCSIVSVLLTDAGQIEVVTRCNSGLSFCYDTYPQECHKAEDMVHKDIYGVEDGKIVQLRVVKGKHTPAEMVPEKIEFPE